MEILKVKVLCCVLAFVVYYRTLDALFVYDDTRAILQNRDLLPTSPWSNLLRNDFWGTPLSHNGSHKSYRPLCTLTFKLNYLVSGYQPFGYHLVNVLLHVAVTYLFVTLAQVTMKSHLEVAISGVMFALHPVHCEAVAGIVGRADILSAIFFILALLTYREHGRLRDRTQRSPDSGSNLISRSQASKVFCDKNGNVIVEKKIHRNYNDSNTSAYFKSSAYLLGTVFLSGCAMLSKEQGVTVIGVCFVQDLVGIIRIKKSGVGKNDSYEKVSKILKSLLVLTNAAIGLLYIRGRVMGFSNPTFATADNPASGSNSLLTRTLTYNFLSAFNFYLLLCPVKLSFDWSMSSIELVESVFDVRNIGTFSLYCSTTFTAFKILQSLLSQNPQASTKRKAESNSSLVILSFSIMILSFLPASNLLFYVGFVVAERILYIPSVGYCLLAGHAVARALTRKRQIIFRWSLICLTAILLLSYALRTTRRVNDWQDEENLYRSGIEINPPKALGNLGNVLTQKGRYVAAEMSFREALNFRPNMADVHYNLGVLLQKQKRLPEAVQSYQNAIKFRPKLALAHLNLALTLADMNRKAEALEILLKIPAISDDGTKDPLSHATTKVSALFNAGRILLELREPHKALAVLQEAAQRGQDIGYGSQQGIFNLLGEAHQTLNNTTEAERWYRAALAVKPDHIPAYLMYGKMLAKNKTRQAEAERFFAKANELAPHDASVHLHYGSFLLDSSRSLEAGLEFERATQINPQDFESSFNAGVAYRLAGKNDQAEKFYRHAVKLRPKDASAHMNLGAMLHLVGKIQEAEDHYIKALELNPDDEATKTNLQRLHNIMKKKGLPLRKKINP